VELTLYYSEHGLLINLDGGRFVDETLGDHLNAMALLEQRQGRALLIADQRVHDDWIVASYVEGIQAFDKFDLVRRRGARCAVANDLSDFDYIPDDWGYDGPAVRAAVEKFNAGWRDPSRQLDDVPLDKPPYYVVEVVPAVTFPLGGLLIDRKARVLDSNLRPLPGLLAAGADSGGLYDRAYAGGLAAALVFGLTAAETALDETDRHASLMRTGGRQTQEDTDA
jgi:succinate dehydrogenase/fumarate reductase flavoprotein subunit